MFAILGIVALGLVRAWLTSLLELSDSGVESVLDGVSVSVRKEVLHTDICSGLM